MAARPRPSRQLMVEVESGVRTLHTFAGVLQGRMALARASGSRREFEGVSEGELQRAGALCDQAVAAIGDVLARLSPELAFEAAQIADVICQRELEIPPGATAPALRLIAADDRSA
jgi:hypothetical protein